MVEVIKDEHGVVLCHIIRAMYNPQKTEFFTPSNYSQQLGIIKYPKGGVIKAHFHNKVAREVFYTQEVLVIRKGKVKVNLFNNENMGFLTSVILQTGDTILLASGGHGFEMLEDSDMLEIKQGPYNGIENDKTHIG
jgi:hypothetical protein